MKINTLIPMVTIGILLPSGFFQRTTSHGSIGVIVDSSTYAALRSQAVVSQDRKSFLVNLTREQAVTLENELAAAIGKPLPPPRPCVRQFTSDDSDTAFERWYSEEGAGIDWAGKHIGWTAALKWARIPDR